MTGATRADALRIAARVLLPAALALLGERSWYLPRWLRWLPGERTELAGATQPGPGSHP